MTKAEELVGKSDEGKKGKEAYIFKLRVKGRKKRVSVVRAYVQQDYICVNVIMRLCDLINIAAPPAPGL